MSGSLSDAQRERLVKLLGRLGSDNEHERALAAEHVTSLLRNAGLTWYDIVIGDGGDGSDQYQLGYEQGFQEAAERALQIYQAQTQELAELRQRVRGALTFEQHPWAQTQDASITVKYCIEAPCFWTEFEKKFMDNVRFRTFLTPKQERILSKLSEKAYFFTKNPDALT